MIQYLSAFRLYGVDVLLLALGVTLVCSLLKKTVLKNIPKKALVFLPFLLGLVFFAVYRAIVTLSASPFTTQLGETFEGGFACGCASTLYYVVYEQFIRGKNVNPVYPLLEGFVPERKRKEAADALYALADKTEEELPALVRETLAHYCETPTEEEMLALCALVEKYLLTLRIK